MVLSKFLNPQNDFAFKRIFGSARNKDILIHFINDMLGFTGDQAVQEVSFLKTHQDPEIASKKQSILDVLCTDQRQRQYIVEMQVAKTAGFEKRAQYYAAKAYMSQLNSGEDYHQLKEIIFLAITDFVMFPDKAAYKSDHVVLDKQTHSHDLTDFSFTFVELPKFKKSIDELQTIVEKWTYFFKHAEETHENDLARLIGSDKIIERAYQELNRFSWSEIDLNTYEQEEKHERDAVAILKNARDEGKAEGKAEGLLEGEQKGKAEGLAEGGRLVKEAIIKKLRAQGLSETAINKIIEIKDV